MNEHFSETFWIFHDAMPIIVDPPLTLTFELTSETYYQSLGAQQLYIKSIQSFLAASIPFLWIIIKSKMFETFQFLSHHYTHHLHNEWRKSMAFWRFWPAFHRINMHVLVLDIYSAKSSAFLIQPILLDVNDVPQGIVDFLTICRRSERRVM